MPTGGQGKTEKAMITRRSVLLTGTGLAGTGTAFASGRKSRHASRFVGVENGHFLRDGRPYRYVGTNMWYGAYLGSFAEGQKRLRRELDALCALGIANLRVLGASEISPLAHSLRPAIRDAKPPYNETLLGGLDFLLAEMGRRDMKAVIFLNNFWEWSGGMVTYQYWTNGGHFINLGDPAHPWPEFADFSARFYASAKANALYRAYVAALIGRRNDITGIAYRDDPTIMSWQLANEPRPGGSIVKTDFKAFYAWIADTAAFIKRLDRNHLVSTGNEGTKGCLESAECVVKTNSFAAVDYLTFHIWPLNWGWIDLKNLAGTYGACEASTRAYIAAHLKIAKKLNKPAVVEEFGFPRDGGSYAPTASTGLRDRYYGLIFQVVEESARQNGPFAGSNFWAWGGEGRARHPDFLMKPADTAYVGDPPQEPQGCNSVFDSDKTTLAIIRRHDKALRSLAM
jgi:mannan endo-1,4-beta-mannosidase